MAKTIADVLTAGKRSAPGGRPIGQDDVESVRAELGEAFVDHSFAADQMHGGELERRLEDSVSDKFGRRVGDTDLKCGRAFCEALPEGA